MSAGAGISVQLTLNAAQFRQQLGVGMSDLRNFVGQANRLAVNIPVNLAGWQRQAAQINQQIAQWQQGVTVPVQINANGLTVPAGANVHVTNNITNNVGGGAGGGGGAGTSGGGGGGRGGFGRGFPVSRLLGPWAMLRTAHEAASVIAQHGESVANAETPEEINKADIQAIRRTDQMGFGLGRLTRPFVEELPGTTSLEEREVAGRKMRENDRDFHHDLDYAGTNARYSNEYGHGAVRLSRAPESRQMLANAANDKLTKDSEINLKYAKEAMEIAKERDAIDTKIWRGDVSGAEGARQRGRNEDRKNKMEDEKKTELGWNDKIYKQKVEESKIAEREEGIRHSGEQKSLATRAKIADLRQDAEERLATGGGTEEEVMKADHAAALEELKEKQRKETEEQRSYERNKLGGKEDTGGRRNLENAQRAERQELHAKQDMEADEADRRRKLAAARSSDKIADIGAEAEEGLTAARGDTEGAAKARLKRQLDDRVKALREQANAERDIVKSGQLSAEADAEERAKPKQIQAQEIKFARENAERLTDIKESTNEAQLKSDDRYYEAAESARNSHYDKLVKLARESGHEEQAKALEGEKAAAQKESDARHDDEIKHINASAAAIGERALGHNASAGLIGLREEMRESEDKATGDPEKLKAVRAENQAKLREFIHGERTPATFTDFEGAYKSMQLSILNGGDDKSAARAKARGLLDPNDPANAALFGANKGGAAGGNAGGAGGGGLAHFDFGDIKDAGKDLKDAAAGLKGMPIGVIRS